MPFEVQLHRPQARFEILYRGDVDLAQREVVVLRVAAVAAATGFQQVLVDLREARCAPQDFVSSNRFAALLARHALRGGWRIAYLARAQPDPAANAAAATARAVADATGPRGRTPTRERDRVIDALGQPLRRATISSKINSATRSTRDAVSDRPLIDPPIAAAAEPSAEPLADPVIDALLGARGVVFGRFATPAAAQAWLQAGTHVAAPRGRAKATSLAPATLRPALLAGCCA